MNTLHPQTVEEATKAWPFAVAHLTDFLTGTPHVNACAFCFDTPDGFAFINPSYADPNAAGQHCFHRIVAKLTFKEDGWTFEGPEWSGHVERYESTVQQLELLGDCLEWLERHFEEEGLNVERERLRVKKSIREDLG